jgi:hypothetical protein
MSRPVNRAGVIRCAGMGWPGSGAGRRGDVADGGDFVAGAAGDDRVDRCPAVAMDQKDRGSGR